MLSLKNKKMNIHLVVLVVAIVLRILWRPRSVHAGGVQDIAVASKRDTIHVITSFDVRDPWREHVTRWISTASVPIRVSLLLSCKSKDDIQERDAIDEILSPIVHIEVSWRVPEHPNDRLRLLVKKFVSGDERVIVAMTKDVTPIIQWGTVLAHHVKIVDEGGIISCPTSALDGRARFPTLRKRSTGAIARNTSVAMATRDRGGDDDVVPSVCWCPEFTMMSGRTAYQWSAMKTQSFVNQSHQCPHFVLTEPILEHNDRVEDDMIDFDEGSEEYQASDCEFVGITKHSNGHERIQKYGSLFHARLAIQAETR